MGKCWENTGSRAIFYKMAKGNIPDPVGKLTGFPYEVIWEHLNPDWETFELDPEKLVKIEARFAVARALGAPAQLCVELS